MTGTRTTHRPLLEELEPREVPILNGVPTSAFPAVGVVTDRTQDVFGSGTLISPFYVLTAAHCVEGMRDTEARFQVAGQQYKSARIFLFPGYRPLTIGTDRANDIALVKLRRPVLDVAPMAISRLPPALGQELTLVGLGEPGGPSGAYDDGLTIARAGQTPIESVSSTLIQWGFNDLSEANTGPGDSGGPAFVSVGGAYYIAGITSGGDRADAGLGSSSFDTRVDPFAGWIDGVLSGRFRPAARFRRRRLL